MVFGKWTDPKNTTIIAKTIASYFFWLFTAHHWVRGRTDNWQRRKHHHRMDWFTFHFTMPSSTTCQAVPKLHTRSYCVHHREQDWLRTTFLGSLLTPVSFIVYLSTRLPAWWAWVDRQRKLCPSKSYCLASSCRIELPIQNCIASARLWTVRIINPVLARLMVLWAHLRHRSWEW